MAEPSCSSMTSSPPAPPAAQRLEHSSKPGPSASSSLSWHELCNDLHGLKPGSFPFQVHAGPGPASVTCDSTTNRRGEPGPLQRAVRRRLLQQPTELIDRQTRAPHDRSHGDRMDRVVTRDSDDARAVGHHDVLALTPDVEAGLLQSADRIEVVDACKLGHG